MEVIPIDQLRSAVSQAIMQACLGVDDTRGRGMVIDMPEEVDIQCTVVFGWQELEMRSVSEGTSEDTRTGGESTTRRESDTSESETLENTANGHDQTTENTYQYD